MNRRDAIKGLAALGTLGAISGFAAAAAYSREIQNKTLHNAELYSQQPKRVCNRLITK